MILRSTAAMAVLASLAGVLAGCSAGNPGGTVTVTASPPAAPTSSAGTAPAGEQTSSAPPAVQGPQPCTTSGLQVYLGLSQGATGHIYQVIDFRNISGATCTLFGYPGVSFAAGSPVTQVGLAADENPATPRITVTLAPGGVASALLAYLQAGFVVPPSKCAVVSTTYIQVYPPNQTTPTYVAYNSQICSNRSVHELRIDAIRVGSGGG
jgi:hypothetical protein